MFGYIMPRKPELKVREWYAYRAEYCGLCKELQRSYGLTSRLFLNYDVLLMALLYDSLHEETPSFLKERCIVSPIKKQWIAKETSGLSFAASCLVLLSHHKLRDDISDETFWKRTGAHAACHALQHAYHLAKSAYPQLDQIFSDCMNMQETLESAACTEIDRVADPTAQMVANMAVACAAAPEQKKHLFRFGLFLGKIIYLLDAAEDFDKDAERGRYNVFIRQHLKREEMINSAVFQCKMAASELSSSYSMLEIRQEHSLLDNIVYLGIPLAISHIGCEKKRSIKHDESI